MTSLVIPEIAQALCGWSRTWAFRQPGSYARFSCGVAAFIVGLLAFGFTARAQSSAPPDVVKLPTSLNLGSSSFYDGFGSTAPGWTTLNYFRWDHFTSIRTGNGQSSPQFVSPHIDGISNIFQAVYATRIPVPNGAITFEAVLPVVDLQSHFEAPGLVLHDNGLNFGDLAGGVVYQSKPITTRNGAIFSWRADVDVSAPTGGFDRSKDINQGTGFWSIEPYVAVTLLPLPKWEISTRFNYIYSLPTSRGSDPPQSPGFVFLNGQAGQAAWINFASSYEILEGVRPGLNGFWLQQLTDDITNGISIPGTRVSSFYLGPGLNWQVKKSNILNFNVYLPVTAKNTPAGPQFNVLFIRQL